jgi:hypothetical protein
MFDTKQFYSYIYQGDNKLHLMWYDRSIPLLVVD